LVGLAAMRHRPTRSLSGGQRQRLAMAGALAMEPDLLILDEPTAMLDPRGQEEVLAAVRRLNRRKKTAVLWITHRLEDTLLAHRPAAGPGGGRRPCGPAAGGAAGPGGIVGAAAAGRDPPGRGPPAARPPRGRGGRHPPGRHRDRPPGLARWGDGPVIEARGISHTFPGGVVALRGVDLTLRPGEAVALMGETGAGKSTLAQILAGLLRPSVGQVRWAGRPGPAGPWAPAGEGLRVAYLFQEAEHQLFEPTVWEDVAFGPRQLG